MRQTNNHDIARIWNLVAKQHLHNPQLNLALGCIVNNGIAPRLEYPHEPVLFALENTLFYEPVESHFSNRICAKRGAFHPKARILSVVRLGNIRQRRIEQAILELESNRRESDF